MFYGVYKLRSFTRHNMVGISSIKETIEKYDGTIDIEHTSNLFTVAIIIPIIQESQSLRQA